MKYLLVGALLAIAVPARAQVVREALPFPVISPAEAQKLATEKPIALHLRAVTLEAAIAQLQTQSGIEIGFGARPESETMAQTLSLDLETRSFIEAFEAIFKAARVEAHLEHQSDVAAWQVQFGKRDNDDALGAGVGPFAVELAAVESQLHKTARREAGQWKRERDLLYAARLQPVPAPQLPWITGPRFRLTRAEDEAGRSLIYTGEQFDFDRARDWAREWYLPLQTPAPGAQTLAHLEGVMDALLFTKREHWEVPDALRAANGHTKSATHEFKSNGQTVRLTLQSVRIENPFVHLQLRVSSPATRDLGAFATAFLSNNQLLPSFRLIDAQGRTFISRNETPVYGDDNVINVSANFDPRTQAEYDQLQTVVLAEPIKLVFDAPIEWVQTQVPFSFENVPLP